MNEAETRAEHIDPALKAAGWGVVEGSRIQREYPITLGRLEGYGRRGKQLTADYVLEYRNTKQQVFLDFVLSHYVREGVQELDQEKLTPLLRLKYQNSIADAIADLGKPEEIGKVFVSFQKYLYQEQVAA
jgi:type I site-specific restriction endonuclease